MIKKQTEMMLQKSALQLLLLLILILGLIGCQTNTIQAGVLETDTPPPAVASTNNKSDLTQSSISLPTLPPPPITISEPTAAPTVLPTNTPAPTSTSTPTSTSAPILATFTPLANPRNPQHCRSLDQLEGVRSPYTVIGSDWPRPSSAEPVELFTGYNNEYKMIHLGFDVENSAEPVEEILDVLDRRGVKTTMFILGSWAEKNPELVKEMARRGHEFANHAYSHQNLHNLSEEVVQTELEQTETIVQQLVGKTTKPWLRPPFGARSKATVKAAMEAGWTTLIWSGSTEDWRAGSTAEIMCTRLLYAVEPGSILYAHTNNPRIPDVIDRFIGEMQARGYTFVPISVILSADHANYLTVTPP